ncbi:MAG: prepilin-type N-terminal cleavage/methylation domain-containing protein [Candidatus Saccharimonas sp.]|nr:prepilin-type N-terminal cleavage/methylation domain-containing protein [Planctomycetaceae bacterium]
MLNEAKYRMPAPPGSHSQTSPICARGRSGQRTVDPRSRPVAPAARGCVTCGGTSGQQELRREPSFARRGFTLIELISTCILLAVVFSVSIPLLTVVAHERRSSEQRQFALQHATNLLERTMTRTWSELTVGEQELTAPPADVQTLLPGLERRVEVKELSETPRSKQVAVSVRWKGRSGEFVSPIRLSAWVYPNGEETQ